MTNGSNGPNVRTNLELVFSGLSTKYRSRIDRITRSFRFVPDLFLSARRYIYRVTYNIARSTYGIPFYDRIKYACQSVVVFYENDRTMAGNIRRSIIEKHR